MLPSLGTLWIEIVVKFDVLTHKMRSVYTNSWNIHQVGLTFYDLRSLIYYSSTGFYDGTGFPSSIMGCSPCHVYLIQSGNSTDYQYNVDLHLGFYWYSLLWRKVHFIPIVVSLEWLLLSVMKIKFKFPAPIRESTEDGSCFN